jgi:SHS2 domain-containing protein
VTQGYRFIDHTADFGLEIFGTDETALFEQAARALFDLIVDPVIDPALLEKGHARTIKVVGQDWADLMVNWLRELLYLWNGEAQLVSSVFVTSLEQNHLQATVTSEKYNCRRHEIKNEIKAVTYHQIEVGPYEDGWRAKVIFDI